MSGRVSTWAATIGGLMCVALLGSALVGSAPAGAVDCGEGQYPPNPCPPPSPPTTPTTPAVIDTGIPESAPSVTVGVPAVGQATVTTSSGQTTTVIVIPNSPAGSIQVNGGLFRLDVDALNPAGQPIRLDANGNMIVNPGGDVVARGQGFVPGTLATLYLLGGPLTQPILLGQATVNAERAFVAPAQIPPDLAPGIYILQITGIVASGTVTGTGLSRQLRIDPQVQEIQVSLQVEARATTSETKAVRTIVYFDVLSSRLTVPARVELRKLANRLPNRASRSNVVTIVGFVGAGGPSWNNSSLSRARAATVADFLRQIGVRGTFRIAGAGLSPKAGFLARSANVSVRSA